MNNLTLPFDPSMCACVDTVILGFSCFGKYLFVKGIDMKQKEKKKGLSRDDSHVFR